MRGALNVIDGESHERIPLDARQIRDGNATYRPVSADITFRLELLRPDNSVASETYRVLLRTEAAEPRTPVAKKSAMSPPVAPPAKPVAKAEGPADEGYVEPEVVNRVAPEVPEGIRPRITAPQPIDVRVSNDRGGRVTSASPLQHGDGLINYLGDRAVAAARRSRTSRRPSGAGNPSPAAHTIHFVFEQ